MSTPDSRKSFLSKLALCAIAASTLPGLAVRRWLGREAPEPESAVGSRGAAPVLAVKSDVRAVARDSSLST